MRLLIDIEPEGDVPNGWNLSRFLAVLGQEPFRAELASIFDATARCLGEAETLLPLLAVALRSLRGPEFRAGMVSMVQFLRRHPEAEAVVRRAVPELRMAPEALVAG